MPSSGAQAAAAECEAGHPTRPIADSQGSAAAAQEHADPETALQQWAGVCIVPLCLDQVSMKNTVTAAAQPQTPPPTHARHGTYDSRIHAAQQEAVGKLIGHNSDGHGAAPAAEDGTDSLNLEGCVDWDVIAAWLDTPASSMALVWEGLDTPVLEHLLKVRPGNMLYIVQAHFRRAGGYIWMS